MQQHPTNPNYVMGADGKWVPKSTTGEGGLNPQQPQQPVVPPAQQPVQQPVQQPQQPAQPAQQPVQQPQQPQQPQIPFIAGLDSIQQQDIFNLVSNKPVTQWSDEDIRNWNYATSNAPLPGTGHQQTPQLGVHITDPTMLGNYTEDEIVRSDGKIYTKPGMPLKGEEAPDEMDELEGELDEDDEDPYLTSVKNIFSKYGMDLPDPDVNPYDQFYESYKKVYEDLGLPNVKTQLEDLNKQMTDIANERDDEIREVNDNPWLTEGMRQRRIARISEKFNDRINNLTNQFNMYQGIFEKGIQEAQFVSSKAMELNRNSQMMTQDLIFKAIDLAQKESAAFAKSQEFDPSRYRSVGTGLFDLQTMQWVIPQTTKSTGGGTGGGNTITGTPEEQQIRAGVQQDILAIKGGDGYLDSSKYKDLRQHIAVRYPKLSKWFDDTYPPNIVLNPNDPTAKTMFPTASERKEEPKRFISTDYFKSRKSDSVLKQAAKEAGYSSSFGRVTDNDLKKYLENLMSQVENFRKGGFTDEQILKLL